MIPNNVEPWARHAAARREPFSRPVGLPGPLERVAIRGARVALKVRLWLASHGCPGDPMAEIALTVVVAVALGLALGGCVWLGWHR